MKPIFLLGLIALIGTGFLLYGLQPAKVSHAPASAQSAAVSNSMVSPATLAAATSAPAITPAVSPQHPVSSANTPMQFEVVTTQAAQERGLGGRAVIPDNYAMLFVFPKDDRYGFWMKDMLAPIDMIWLADDGTIVSVNKSVPADSYPEVFYPSQPVRYVLETKAGFFDEKGWNIGTKVSLPLPY